MCDKFSFCFLVVLVQNVNLCTERFYFLIYIPGGTCNECHASECGKQGGILIPPCTVFQWLPYCLLHT